MINRTSVLGIGESVPLLWLVERLRKHMRVAVSNEN